jgi:molybdopterin-binding protein
MLGTRNQFQGTVKSVKLGNVMAQMIGTDISLSACLLVC